MSDDAISPYTLSDDAGDADDVDAEDGRGGRRRAFWADRVADVVEARNPSEPIVIKGGISPSGVPHLGNMNEVMRGYFVAEVLRERGHEVRQVFTSDDRDPLRKLPRKLADLEGDLVDLGDVDAGALGRNLGHPYTAIPDPFGCCDSYGAHFSNLIQSGADALGVPIDLVSNTELYESGEFEDVTRYVLEHVDEARDVLREYQDKVDDDYVPFNPICAECGKVTETVTAIRASEGEVDYECTDMEAGDQVISGCGHEGTASLRQGKLPWRLEWPAQWQVLGVDFEPFGKDHAEGSWPSGEDVARNLLGNEPPVPMVYEWFTLDGEPFSSSEGHVVLVDDVLDLLEPEVLRFFFAKNPKKARDFPLSRLDQLVDEFDRFERIYYGDVEGTEEERERAERVYPFLVDHVEPGTRPEDVDSDGEERPVRIPYTFAAVLGMFPDHDVRVEHAVKQGHLPEDPSDAVVDRAFERVERARNWAGRMDNEYNYTVLEDLPEVAFDAETEAALDELAAFVEAGHDGEAIQGEIYETAKDNGIPIGEFFAAGYELFFGEDEGPQLGQFLGKLETEFVVQRLRREA
ncbi:lysine--tRNA ligase [Halorubellus sp. JP-L1]|uniref:lysine--tRNA ligase n=1 Tax=Halorubellus sp. JP-L1 TaxID=2715753 RepID=UPI00140A9094|nr:lysine--tRNA ligase [Halorubellus sp. JP-L1]